MFWQIYSLVYNKLNELKPYQDHIEKILEYLGPPGNGLIADLGCGTGNLIKNRRGIVGLDFAETMLRFARSKNPNAIFIMGNLNGQLPFKDNSFDAVYSNNVLAYLKAPLLTLREIHRILRPGGSFILATLRPSFSPLAILREQLRSVPTSHSIKNIFFIAAILIMNIPIVLKLRLKIYQGFEPEQMATRLSELGFNVLAKELSYANQDLLIVAKRK